MRGRWAHSKEHVCFSEMQSACREPSPGPQRALEPGLLALSFRAQTWAEWGSGYPISYPYSQSALNKPGGGVQALRHLQRVVGAHRMEEKWECQLPPLQNAPGMGLPRCLPWVSLPKECSLPGAVTPQLCQLFRGQSSAPQSSGLLLIIALCLPPGWLKNVSLIEIERDTKSVLGRGPNSCNPLCGIPGTLPAPQVKINGNRENFSGHQLSPQYNHYS